MHKAIGGALVRNIIHKDKNGEIIKDISKVEIPFELEVSIFKILNPGMTAVKRETVVQ